MAFTNAYKIVVLGDFASGKTTWVHDQLSQVPFSKKYLPTLGVDVYPISLETLEGVVTFNVWDCAGQEKYGGLRDGYYINGEACIAFFDLSSPLSFIRTAEKVKDYQRLRPNTSILWVGNKCDLDLNEKTKEFNKLIEEKLANKKYLKISMKDGTNKNLVLPSLYEMLPKKSISKKRTHNYNLRDCKRVRV
jgi:GTP-binding nuclear protein Ran